MTGIAAILRASLAARSAALAFFCTNSPRCLSNSCGGMGQVSGIVQSGMRNVQSHLEVGVDPLDSALQKFAELDVSLGKNDTIFQLRCFCF